MKFNLTEKEYQILCDVWDAMQHEEGLDAEIVTPATDKVLKTLVIKKMVKNHRDYWMVTDKGKKAIDDYDGEWIDPSGGTHYGREEDPAKMYEYKQFKLANIAKTILKTK